ncbi:hypothetical protein [Veillonella tobetsuensis]|uniref:hypothetical protein n=1 Tax=Veillonella tobetsuensis TaxID=1110546 RepID=UPI00248D65E6|nr:hypothetical protein [Veillonella tobetsuensis]
MGRLIKWLKEKLTSFFRKKGDTVTAIQIFDEHGETVADLSTGLTKIIWTKELTTIEPEFSVKTDIYEGQKLFALREYYGTCGSNDYEGDYVSYINGDTVTFAPLGKAYIGRPCQVKLMIGVCE